MQQGDVVDLSATLALDGARVSVELQIPIADANHPDHRTCERRGALD